MFQRIIHLIHKTTAAITHGNLSQRIPLTGNGNEGDEVTTAINTMLDSISQQMDNVRQTSNAIAHDLRAPIARARSQLEDGALHARTEAELRTAIEHAIEQLDHVTSICDSLLRIAQIEAGSRHSAFSQFDLVPALRDILELYAAVAEDRGITIKTIFPEKLPFYGDRAMFQQAIANVLDNAIKFSPPKGVIACSAQLILPSPHSENDGIVEIAITDHGVGMTPQDMTHATQRFFRAEQTHHISGSGLGLSLVQAIVQRHGGQLHLANNNPGLIVRIEVPLPRTKISKTMEINR
ncbi:ATP-binding protein [Acetobacter oryzifermentans]|uniref:HAMP domain-containing sensor histidine kinase n=1 Tax=Acetobacter oryzifermentans TaxID=1633874 RepID=UPI0039BFA056